MTPIIGSVCYKLFHHSFTIQMQNRFFYTEEHMKRVLGLTTGSDQFDRDVRNEYTQITRTPINMVCLHREGIPFSIVYPKDIIEIYDLLRQHLENWTAILSRPLSSKRPPPVEDFIAIEHFMVSIKFIVEQMITMHVDNRPSNEESEFWAFFRSMMPDPSAPMPMEIQPDLFDVALQPPKIDIRTAWSNSTWGQNYGNT